MESFGNSVRERRVGSSVRGLTRAAHRGNAMGLRRTNSDTLDFHAGALASPTSRLAHLLAALDRRLHEMASALELTQNAFASHLALEMLDGALDALVSDLDLERLALD